MTMMEEEDVDNVTPEEMVFNVPHHRITLLVLLVESYLLKEMIQIYIKTVSSAIIGFVGYIIHLAQKLVLN